MNTRTQKCVSPHRQSSVTERSSVTLDLEGNSAEFDAHIKNFRPFLTLIKSEELILLK